jgi:CheY-like chemotaxis protein
MFRDYPVTTSTETGVLDTTGRPPLFVLIVEDNVDGRESLRLLLELYGYHVEVASDGIEGVEKAHEMHPDVVLIDIGLPRLNGYEVARRLRDEFGPRVRLIACTAYSDPEVRKHALESGFDDFQLKPMDLDHIVEWLAGGDDPLAG